MSALRALPLLVLAAACARRPADPPAADAAARPGSRDTVAISLERQPCFGTCPVYTVTLDGSGAVHFEGRRFVKDTGTVEWQVPRERVDSLVHDILAAGYFDLPGRYAMGEPACGRYATDLPTVITSVRIGSRTKEVHHDYGCEGAPERLAALERRIDEVAAVSGKR